MDSVLQTQNAYGVDITLLQERLKLTPTHRIIEHQKFMDFLEKLNQTSVKDNDHKFSKTNRNPTAQQS